MMPFLRVNLQQGEYQQIFSESDSRETFKRVSTLWAEYISYGCLGAECLNQPLMVDSFATQCSCYGSYKNLMTSSPEGQLSSRRQLQWQSSWQDAHVEL